MAGANAKKTIVVAALATCFAGCSPGAGAQSGGADVPYKLGTFARGGEPFVGLVLEDTRAVDIREANAAFEASNGSAPKLTPPGDNVYGNT